MISIGQEQHLGYKAFILLVLRRMSAGIVFLILVLAILVFRYYLSGGVTTLISMTGVLKTDAANTASIILIYATLILFWLGILVCFIGFIIAYLEYITHTYTFNEFNLIMKSGILDKKETSIPYRQIQDINVDRPLIYQFLGLSKLVLRTAGTEEKNELGLIDIHIDPIDKNTAEEIKTMLGRKIGVQIVKDETRADKEEK